MSIIQAALKEWNWQDSYSCFHEAQDTYRKNRDVFIEGFLRDSRVSKPASGQNHTVRKFKFWRVLQVSSKNCLLAVGSSCKET